MNTTIPIPSSDLLTLHTESILLWEKGPITCSEKGLKGLIEENHAFNFQLWHAEDRARREDKGFEYVYLAKREIDGCNQERNNRMEAIDAWLFDTLKPEQSSSCPIHSETPGMMVDRLSILSLKAHYMQIQTKRQDVDRSHQERSLQKLQKILAQQQQLLLCLEQLFQEVLAKKRTFKVYHQFKMYNDPSLNPQLYGCAS